MSDTIRIKLTKFQHDAIFYHDGWDHEMPEMVGIRPLANGQGIEVLPTATTESIGELLAFLDLCFEQAQQEKAGASGSSPEFKRAQAIDRAIDAIFNTIEAGRTEVFMQQATKASRLARERIEAGDESGDESESEDDDGRESLPLVEKAHDEDIKKCPHCLREGTVKALFGYRNQTMFSRKGGVKRAVKRIRYAQDWCRRCKRQRRLANIKARQAALRAGKEAEQASA